MGVTSIDLFRSGNAAGAGLDRVRINSHDPDVNTFTDPVTGADWVQADGMGASTFDAPQTTWTGKTWYLPKGSPYPDTLLVWNDDPGHWAWSPATDMPLSAYLDALRTASALFVKV